MLPTTDDLLRGLVAAHEAELLDFARSRLPPGGEHPEDSVQEVFAAFAKTADAAPVEQPRAWLFRALRNRVTDAYRRAAARPPIAPLDGSAHAADYPAVQIEWTGTDDAPDDDTFWTDVDAALAALPTPQREVFERNVLDGETLQTIADDLRIPLRTAISRKRYARQRLRDLLADTYVNFFGDQ